MGSVLASTVIRDVQAKDVEHPDGWTCGQKYALVVIADAANYKTGRMKSSMLTLAEQSGASEKTLRRAAERAIADGLCIHEGYFMGKSRILRFPNPLCIGEPEPPAGSDTEVEPDPVTGSTGNEPEANRTLIRTESPVEPDFDSDRESDIPVVPVPVVPELHISEGVCSNAAALSNEEEKERRRSSFQAAKVAARLEAEVGNVLQTFGSDSEDEPGSVRAQGLVRFTDDDEEDAGDPPMVVRRIAAADIEELERAKLRRRDPGVIEAVAAIAVNAGDNDA
jgi:hypothetical protein